MNRDLLTNIQLNCPQVLALLHVGATSYLVLIDQRVRRNQLNSDVMIDHWKALVKNSKAPMSALSVSTILSAFNSYRIQPHINWIIGGLLMLSLFPYTTFFLQKE